jgi:hypothetical protein
MSPRTTFRFALAFGLALASGCGAGFTVRAPDDFVSLDDASTHGRGYAMRATSADGVVVGVRALDNDRHGSTEFWVEAIRNRLRRDQGYALVSEADVSAASGQRGHQMRFGHDDGGHPYVYWVTVFVTHDRIFVVEAGGRRDRFEPATGEVESAIGTFAID